ARVLAEQDQFAPRRSPRQGQQGQQGRLPRPRGTGKEVERARWQDEVNVPQHVRAVRIAEAHPRKADGLGRGVGQGGAAGLDGHRFWVRTRPFGRDGRGRNASQSAHMILTCPSCATSYFTPDEAIGAGGRTVRCQNCKHTWRATLEEPLELSVSPPGLEPAAFSRREEPEVPESLAETPAPELPRAFRARAEQQRRLRRAAAHGVVWAGIASGFAALLAAAWLFRVEVVETMPRAAAAYAAVGLTVNPTGLEFEA